MQDATVTPNVLIVDDNPNNLRVLEGLLRGAGYKVRPALNGEAALRAVQAAPPDLILLDIRMPGLDGFSVCRQLKADAATREIPVIFISALQDAEDKTQAFHVGGVDYIVKPFEATEVLARVRTHLELARTLKQQSRLNEWLEQQVAEHTQALILVNEHLLRTTRDEHALRDLLALSHHKFADPHYLEHALTSLAHTIAWRPPQVHSAIFLGNAAHGGTDQFNLVASNSAAADLLWEDCAIPTACLAALPRSSYRLERALCPIWSRTIATEDVVFCLPLLSGTEAIGALLLRVLDGALDNFAAPTFLQQVAEILSIGIARRQADERLAWDAYHDRLTRLPNRRMLEEDLQRKTQNSAHCKQFCALLLIGLDDFKFVNDTLGHGVGDQVLQAVAQRLQNNVSAPNRVFRWVGDEFTVFLPQLGDTEASAVAQVGAFARTLTQTLAMPLLLDGNEVYINASIGIALYPSDGTVAEDLLKHVALALYKAKQEGRGSIHFFSREMQTEAERRLVVDRELRAALISDQFLLHFQPQVNAEGYLIGAETLVRWQHPQKGLVAPGYFIPVAEETGLIGPLGEWILRAACRQIGGWSQQGYNPKLRLAVNISAWQFYQDDFVEQVQRHLQHSVVAAESIELEVTESLLLADISGAVKKMNVLRDLGISFALDDFGTGYSSLSYLKRLPIDRVKIDRSFVQDVHEDVRNAAIVQAIIDLSHHLGMETVAEGVERIEEVQFLTRAGCDYFQGFYFSKPLPADVFIDKSDARFPAANPNP